MVEKIQALEQLPVSQGSRLKDELVSAVNSGAVRSMRDAQRFAVRQFVASVLNRSSLAEQFAN
jgi:hypothetical protein